MIASDIGLDDLSLGYNAPMDSCSLILGRGVTGGGGDLPSSLALVVDRGSNRLGGAGYYHDVLGNLVQMPAPDSQDSLFMSCLDQGHIGTLTDAAGVVWKYYSDADGKWRIKVKAAGGAATEPDGQGGVRLVADRSFYFYEGEDLICQQDAGAGRAASGESWRSNGPRSANAAYGCMSQSGDSAPEQSRQSPHLDRRLVNAL